MGDLETRPGHYNAPWSYWSNDYMGFHEYLLLDAKSMDPKFTWTLTGNSFTVITLTPERRTPSTLPLNGCLKMSQHA